MNGWIGMALGIVAYDVWQWRHGGETMSACWRRWIEKAPGKALCALAWGLLSWHLFGESVHKDGASRS